MVDDESKTGKPTYTKAQITELKSGLGELAEQEKDEFGLRELVFEALPEIRAALEKHSYKYIAQWMSEKQEIKISESSLKQYVTQAIKSQAEQAAKTKSRKSQTSKSPKSQPKEETIDSEPDKASIPDPLPQGANSKRKIDY